jgi:hypothetical protein
MFKNAKRRKFGPFHLYKKPYALGASLDDLLGRVSVKKPYAFGEYQVTWGEWKRKIKKLCPIQYWAREELPFYFTSFSRRLSWKWYELKCWFSPYNIIRINTLPKTWSDESELLVHGMFAILEKFMAQNPSNIVDYSSEPYRTAWKELNEVWDWWKERDERGLAISQAQALADSRRNTVGYHEMYKELIELENRFLQEEEEMLIKLIKNRHHLWI